MMKYVLLVLLAMVMRIEGDGLMYIPLDERYATRGMFLNMVRMTEKKPVLSPSAEMLPSRKKSASPEQILNWMETNQDNISTAIVSLEMVLYGGLIASRISNETTTTILNRLERFQRISKTFQHVYVSSVVMRIPSYNGDFEEPWYWQSFGKDLYDYSFYKGKFDATGNETCRQEFEKLSESIPENVLNEFLWRRDRNSNVSKVLLKQIHENSSMFRSAYITLDDSGTYGLNVQEASALQNLVDTYGLSNIVRIYPGADEVGLTLLSKALSLSEAKKHVRIVWRVSGNATHLIPAYENQEIVLTVRAQLNAAGFHILENSSTTIPDLIFAVNNFEIGPQLEASQQPDEISPFADYEDFFRKSVHISNRIPVALADVRYANGGDKSLVHYLLSQKIDMQYVSYAGWNTDGNTLGTSACNGMLLSQLDSANKQESARCCTYLRLVEDLSYQSEVRTMLVSKVLADNADVSNLTPHLSEYESFVYQHLLQDAENRSFSSVLNLSNPTLESVYFPWNRTFEVGLNAYC